MIAGGRTWLFALVILAACGVVLIRETTQHGPGLYIEMTHYPLFYSLVLGGFEALGFSAPRTARLIRRNSPTIAYVKAASADTIYTNDINALYLAANKASCSIPARHSVAGLETMRSSVQQSQTTWWSFLPRSPQSLRRPKI